MRKDKEEVIRMRADILKQKQAWAEAFESKERELIKVSEDRSIQLRQLEIQV